LHKKTLGASVARIISRAKAQRAKKTSENAAALCVFAPLREKCPRQKTLFVQSRYLAYEAIRRRRRRRDDGYNFSHHRFFWKEFLTPKAQK
jgi:hypothetical protein